MNTEVLKLAENSMASCLESYLISISDSMEFHNPHLTDQEINRAVEAVKKEIESIKLT
ncbi:hypothetical protein SAMN03080615_01615 [Amphritea atlantica]|uniref:Uncharacterized protein n=1 Tax=Amphritea atlantica TaxID=355243 RepID=A0A1H9GD22_9GAMM|nr:hypothetical protein [Amphritea atlantica]SEQ48011.1 hypothetical protein SAMN03080615_01615 [Amphritea atlantica]